MPTLTKTNNHTVTTLTATNQNAAATNTGNIGTTHTHTAGFAQGFAWAAHTVAAVIAIISVSTVMATMAVVTTTITNSDLDATITNINAAVLVMSGCDARLSGQTGKPQGDSYESCFD